jgi:dipeptidyl aminopeptidase/acylaminoacyl peptidase
MVATAPFGRWASPLGAADVATAKVSLYELCSDGASLYWLESRPSEAGRVVLVRARDGSTDDHSPAGVSIRSRVNEYGGGALALVPGRGDGAFAYVDDADQRVWMCDGAAGAPQPPRPLSPVAPEGERHLHGGLGATPDGAWVLAVREAHRPGATRPVRAVIALATTTAAPHAVTLVEGHDFYGAPRVDDAGERLAVVAWDHPAMSWDASQLLVLPLTSGPAEDGTPRLQPAGPTLTIAGGADESVGQPGWRADGTLRFVSDRTGWWQPYVQPGTPRGHAVAWSDEAAEFHGPDWALGQSTMAELTDGTLVARRTAHGRDDVVLLRGPGGTPSRLPQPCVAISALCAHGDGVALLGSTEDAPATVWTCAVPTAAEAGDATAAGVSAARPPARSALAAGDIAAGEAFALIGRRGRAVYGTLYRPVLSSTRAPEGSRPPLLVWCHGGPTSSCHAGLDLTLQFFTTRGFAVACVDYAGSTGYGRAYRDALRGRWGEADAEDCLDAALFLADRSDVDAGRLGIRGGSSGGMTALNALAAGEGFGACVTWYGVTDLLALAATTHDFEAHYTDWLIGPLPEAKDLYEERSPVNRAAAMKASVLLLQGTEDAIVPPDQAERMRDALARVGTSCDLRFFEGEGHGFRRADTLTACLQAELAFYLTEFAL